MSRAEVTEQLQKYSELVKQLLTSISATFDPARRASLAATPEDVVQSIIELDADIQDSVGALQQRHDLQRAITVTKDEIRQQDMLLTSLEGHLRAAETLLETITDTAERKLEIVAKAEASPLNTDELIQYAHRIGMSYGTSAPMNWAHDNPNRPFPSAAAMNSGALAYLAANPHTAVIEVPVLAAAAVLASNAGNGDGGANGADHIAEAMEEEEEDNQPPKYQFGFGGDSDASDD